MSKIRRFIIEIHEDEVLVQHLKDLQGAVNEAIGGFFELDDGVGYGVEELEE